MIVASDEVAAPWEHVALHTYQMLKSDVPHRWLTLSKDFFIS